MPHGYRARIGYTSPPAATEVFPYEFYRMAPEGVTLIVHTLPLIERTSDEVDQGYEASLRAAHAIARAGASVLVLGGLPINVSRGFGNVGQLTTSTADEIKIPVLTSFGAQKAAFEALKAGKVAIVQPYGDDHNDRFMDYARKLGGEPLGAKGLGAKFIELGRVRRDEVRRTAEAVLRAHPKADTLYLPCPHYATAHVIEAVEQEFGVKVITALQAIVWQALRTAGVDDRVAGYGQLLRQ